ncbi:uncharacterized protein LOC108031282 [Drosophila biarmipes]|uniref:uncharacterized protein LOC108031282 n=1 Tax=Drosophila biarmipes TaxID=125945 RepID=UPI0007E7A1CD|nr:uncharacterized protein LOC108031282 [Drosophila biarmipes]
MAYNGLGLPGIFCPDESVEQFARLYGSDNLSKIMIMATSSRHPTDYLSNVQAPVHQNPGVMGASQPRFYGSPSTTDERNPIVNPRYGVHAVQGSRPLMQGACGDHYTPSPTFKNFKPDYPSGHSHAHPGVQNQRQVQYHPQQSQPLNFMYPPPPGPRFPWL